MPIKHSESIWEKPPHTEMKHEILKRYLKAWLPILGAHNKRIVIIDGFAGPGEYIDPENPENRLDGSPVIIIDTILNHSLRPDSEVVLLFIENNKRFSRNLTELIESRYTKTQLKNIKYYIVEGKFAKTLNKILNNLESRGKEMAPSFSFIDPFGPRGIPIKVIAQILSHRRSEVLINYPYDSVNRYLNEPSYEDCLHNLFGCPEWEAVSKETDSRIRKAKLLDLYLQQLHSVAFVNYTLPFEMKNKHNRTSYFLIFGTKHMKGLDEMKKVMWRIAPAGNFQFSDYTHYKNQMQLTLFPPQPDYDELSKSIFSTFSQKKVSMLDVEEWVIVKTQYCSNHVREALKILEGQDKLIKWEYQHRTKNRYTRKNSFPKRIYLEFK